MSTDGIDAVLPPPVNPIDSQEKIDRIQEFKSNPLAIEWLKEHHSDDYISRWLRARDWNVNNAVDMFVKSMKWRSENDIDSLVDRYPSHPSYKKMIEYWPCSYNEVFFTKDGWPVYYERSGIVDPKYLLSVVTPEELTLFHIYEAEKRERLRFELFKERGYTVGTVFIQDFGGSGFRHLHSPALDVVRSLSKIDQDNYPEAVRKLYGINCPTVFSAIWKIVSTFFDAGVVAKFSFYTDNYKNELLSFIRSEDELPTWAKGTREGVAFGGDEFLAKIASESIILEVPASKSLSVPILVQKENSIIEWRFSTTAHDIGFYLAFKTNGSNMEKVFENGRCLYHQGTFTATSIGEYHLVFDNTFSWTKKKTVAYKTTIIEIEN